MDGQKNRLWKRLLLHFLLTTILSIATFGPPPLSAQEGISVIYPGPPAVDSALVFPLIRHGLDLMKTDIDSALKVFKKVEQISRVRNFFGGIGAGLAYIGLAETRRGNYISGFRYYEKALPYCLEAMDLPFVLAYLYNNMAMSYVDQGDLLNARTYFHQSLLTFEKHQPNSPTRLGIYIALAGIQARLGNMERAFHYIDYVIDQTEGTNSQKANFAMAVLAKGSIYYTMEQPDSALYYYHQGVQLGRILNDPNILQSGYAHIGNVLLKKKRYKEAAVYLRKAIRLNNGASEILRGYILPRYSLGAALAGMGKYKAAEKVLLEALAKTEETGLYQNQTNGYSVLSGVYIYMGDLEAALHKVQQYVTLRDSLNKIDKIRAVNEIDTRYQVAIKDKALIQQKLQIARQQEKIRNKNLLLGSTAGGIGLFTLLGISIYLYRQKIKSRELEINRLKASIAGEERERTRISRELHDGVGGMLTGIKLNLRTLQKQTNSIQLPEKLEEIMYMLRDMGEELHVTAHNLMPEVLQNQSLRQALELYCRQLETAGLDLQLQFHNDPEVPDKSLELTIYRIVQELIQNILKHSGASLAVIQISKHGALLCISSEDNGIGFDAQQASGGLGLKNIQMRVQALEGYYALSSSPGRGTTSYIEIETF